ncbi:inositol 1,4,5-triphosphate receptor associated 2-like [Anguilla anguilla]|uniref:inositol 1,4,5-triphosphate receptor associated 2-like n=1 Tax=Anguilla anguilla TaxID=7936 RepID=UPI0015ABB427|nr:inositol 1,4,5-triphosphate receptor associated 2-like [Anguilla anguilla]
MESVDKQNSQEELGDVAEAEEIESQAFHLRAVAFRRDLDSLESRLQCEERSRDQAEEGVKEEVSSSQALLQTLVPLCEHNQKTVELIQRLQKALGVLPAAMMRMSTRSETLGTIKEEKRVTQEVEAMIQQVETLRGVYRAEHTELTELKESLEEKPAPENGDHAHTATPTQPHPHTAVTQQTLSFSTVCNDFGAQQAAGSPYYTLWDQGDADLDLAGLNRRNAWRGAGRNATQPALHRLINSTAWLEYNESSPTNRYEDAVLPPIEEQEAEVKEKLSRLTVLGNKLSAFVKAVRTRDHPVSRMVRSFPAMVRDRSSWEWWTPLVLAVMLASLLALLGTLTPHPAVEAAPARRAA